MNGTLSETRTTTEVVAPKIQTPTIKIVEQPPVIDKEPTVITQPAPKQPEPTNQPTTTHIGDASCRYCMASAIATLSLRFALVVLVLAFSFNLLKSAKQ